MSFSPTDGCTEEHALRDDLSIVEESDALVRNTLLVLTRLPAENPLGEAANEVTRRLRPHLDDALAALGRIEQGRGLTETELARRRAFRMLLAVTVREPEGEAGRPS